MMKQSGKPGSGSWQQVKSLWSGSAGGKCGREKVRSRLYGAGLDVHGGVIPAPSLGKQQKGPGTDLAAVVGQQAVRHAALYVPATESAVHDFPATCQQEGEAVSYCAAGRDWRNTRLARVQGAHWRLGVWVAPQRRMSLTTYGSQTIINS